MKISVFYKISESPQSAPTEAPDTKKELARLKAEIGAEKNAVKKLSIQRKITRLERFDRLQNDTNAKDHEAISKILAKKNPENYFGSDLLSLKKRGIDIATLVLVDDSSVDKEIIGKDISVGQVFTVNFGDNKKLNADIGAGDILGYEISKVKINGIEGIRKNNPRPGYYDEKGKYLPVFDGYKIEIISKGAVNENDKKLADEADGKRWENLRMSDMIDNNDSSLSNLPEDIALKEKLTTYKNNITTHVRGFKRFQDIRKASEFALGKDVFSEVASQFGIDGKDVNKILAIMSAIGVQESSSNYGAMGLAINNPSSSHYGDRAIGRYQIMPINWGAWSKKYFGELLDPKDPSNQDKIAFAQIGTYYMLYEHKGLNFNEIISEISQDWYGRGRTNQGPTTEAYKESVVSIYNSLNQLS